MPYEEVERLVRKEKLEEKYDVGAELGRGKFAIVKRVTEKASGEQFAAKFLRKRRGGKACRDDIIVEVDIMRQSMGHHRIIKLREVFESPREMIIIIELATGGELFRMIAVDPLPEDKARGVVLQLLEGVEHLHSLSIVHLDLKPENILLYRKGQLDIRIADFGLALQIAPGEQVKTLVGTAEYVAPEILNYEPLSVAADMWSIGALTYALLTGYSPFQGETHSDTFCNVSMCEYDFEDEVFDEVSQEAKDFIEELLQKKPSDRLTATKCLSHPWIKNHNPTVLPTSSTVSSSSPSSVPQSQCLHSSTSSLDSALCLDSNNSSLDPSPSSSASSSFAPRPSGRSGDDDEQEDMKKQLTEKVSKLCTEMQKVDSSNSSLRVNVIGSASSISSSDSNTTVRVDEEDGGIDSKEMTGTSSEPEPSLTPPFSSQSATPTQTGSSQSFDLSQQTRLMPSSPKPTGEDDAGVGKRPNSRLTTPIDELISLAPETIEKMKKLERLKRKKDEAQQGEEPKGRREALTKTLSTGQSCIAPRGSDRRVSSPASIKNQKMSIKTQDSSFAEEEEARAIEDTQKPSNSPTNTGSTPTVPGDAKAKDNNEISNSSTAKESATTSTAKESTATSTAKESTATSTAKESTATSTAKESTATSTAKESTTTSTAKESTTTENVPTKTNNEKAVETTAPTSTKNAKILKDDAGKTTLNSQFVEAKRSPKALNVKPAIDKKVMFFSKTGADQSITSSGGGGSPSNDRRSPSSFKREGLAPLSKTAKQEDEKTRSKSETPSSPVVSSKDFAPPPSRSIKSCSPISTTMTEVKRRAKKTQNRKSWRNTPHIDPDVIEAILRGEFDIEDDETSNEAKLETMKEEVEPRNESPLAGRTGTVVLSGTKSHTSLSPTATPILKKGGFSDPHLERVTKSESPRRVVMMVSAVRPETSLESSSSPDRTPPIMHSPLKSPGCFSQTDATVMTSPEKTHLSTLQSSLSLSRSTPDLSTILSSGKHSKRSQGLKEDTYVTGGGSSMFSSRKSSISRSPGIRSSLLSNLTNRSKRSSRDKLK